MHLPAYYMIYLGEKGHYRGKFICNTAIPQGCTYSGERSDTNYGIHPTVESMTVDPEAII